MRIGINRVFYWSKEYMADAATKKPTYEDQLVFELKNQILMAEAINREEIEPRMTEALERYMGKHIPRYGYNWDVILNEVYPIIQTNLPAIFFRNPKFYLKPRQKTFIAKVFNPETGRKEDTELDSQKSASTQEALLNYSLEVIKYKREVRKVLMDALLFPHGILWHGYKGDFGLDQEQSLYVKDGMIFVRRLTPTRFIKDPNVNMANLDEAKWVGRVIDIPYRDFIEDDTLYIKDKRKLKAFKGYGDVVGAGSIGANQMYQAGRVTGGGDSFKLNNLKKNLLDYSMDDFQRSKYSMFVRVYEVFKRPTLKEKKEGKKGKILLLGFDQDEPYRENEWNIKAEGFPAKILQFNEICDALIGMSDIDTYKQIADQKNIITNLQIRNAQENSKVYVSIAKDGSNEEDIQKIQRGDQTILMFEGDNIQGKMQVQSASGGASNELYLIDQRIQKNLDDKSGVTDLRRGVLQSGEESAFSVKMRSMNSSARPQYRQDIMMDFLKESGQYLLEMIKQYMPFEEAVRIMGTLDIQWSENPSQDEIQAETDVEIDALSITPENPDDEIQKLELVLQTLVQFINDPAVQQKITQEGMVFNFSPIIEQLLMRMKIRNPDIFRHMKPEESQGFASVQQLRQAKGNVGAALTGQQAPFPPSMEDDSAAKLEIYTFVAQLLQQGGKSSAMLNQLIQTQTAIQQAQSQQNTQTGNKPSPKTAKPKPPKPVPA
jgi:hypothetical protein